MILGCVRGASLKKLERWVHTYVVESEGVSRGARPKSKLKIRTVYGPLINRLARETAAAPLDETFKIQHWNMSRLLIIAARAGNNRLS